MIVIIMIRKRGEELVKLKLDVTSSTCNPSTQAPWRLRVKTKDPVFLLLQKYAFFLGAVQFPLLHTFGAKSVANRYF